MDEVGYFAHESAVIDRGATIGDETKIWHFSHVMPGAHIGSKCVIGQGCYIGAVKIGDGVKIQNNVSIYDGVTLEADVFCGPSCVFTNVINPRSALDRKQEFKPTLVRRGATIGANATIMCGVTIGAYAFIAAGAVVTKDVKSHALVMGVPARRVGWCCLCGERLRQPEDQRAVGLRTACAACKRMYLVRDTGVSLLSPRPGDVVDKADEDTWQD